MFGNYVSMKMHCVGITQLEERGWGLVIWRTIEFLSLEASYYTVVIFIPCRFQ